MVKVYLYIGILLALFFSCSGVEVEVKVVPETFQAGRVAKLFLIIKGGGRLEAVPAPQAPQGVLLQASGYRNQTYNENGAVSQSVVIEYLLSTQQAGEYTIDPFEVRVSGERIMTKAVSFKVVGASQQIPGGVPNTQQRQLANPPNTQQGPTINTPVEELGFIRLVFAERGAKHLYVGEMALVGIKAYFPPETQISIPSVPRPEGPGFTLQNISNQPEQEIEEFEGKTYRTVTWFAGISLAKAGKMPIAVSLDATLMLPDPAQQPPSRSRRMQRRSNSPFGGLLDSLFDDFIGRSMVTRVPREISLKSVGDDIEIKSLPREGRPENFSGAVGKFKIEGYEMEAEGWITGEPKKIKVTIGGSGNFDRLNAPVLEPQSSWKTYQPKTHFSPGDVASFSGKKTFEFNAVPQKAGPTNLSLAFSYFDPATGSYHEVNSQQIPIVIGGEDLIAAVPQVVPGPQSAEVDEGPVGLAPIRPIVGTSSTSLSPLIHQPFYWFLVILSLVAVAGMYTWQIVTSRRNAPEAVAVRQALAREATALAAVEKAAEGKDVAVFIDTAQEALKQRLARVWGLSPAAITLADLKQRLPKNSPALEIFAKGDALAYGKGSSGDEKLYKWRRVFEKAMNSLDKDS